MIFVRKNGLVIFSYFCVSNKKINDRPGQIYKRIV